MQPKYWGPLAWHLLHTVAYYSEGGDLSNMYKLFYETFEVIIPCLQCRTHYGEYLHDNDSENIARLSNLVLTNDPPGLSKWVCNLHNHAAKHSGGVQWNEKDVRRLYFEDGVLNVSHAHIFKFIDIMVKEAASEHPSANISKFQQYIVFFNTLKHVFPCMVCREGLTILMKKYPIEEEVSDPASLKIWYEKIEKELKRPHLFLNSRAFLLFQKNSNQKEFYITELKHKGKLIFAEKKDGKIYITTSNSQKQHELRIPEDVNSEKMNVITEADVEILGKIYEDRDDDTNSKNNTNENIENNTNNTNNTNNDTNNDTNENTENNTSNENNENNTNENTK